MQATRPTSVSATATIQTPAVIRRLHDVQPLSSATSFASSAGSITFDDGEVDAVLEEGLNHSDNTLEARKYKSSTFASKLLEILHAICIPAWQETEIEPSLINIFKVSATGSFSNAIFFVSCPSTPRLPTLLLRIYGPSSVIISRRQDLHTAHILSSRYNIGPRVYGTFGNGRVEQFFESTTLTASDLRDKDISGWIGACMSELHCVDIEAVQKTSLTNREGRGWEIGATKNVKAWIAPARQVLALPSVSDAVRAELDLAAFFKLWYKYMHWLKEYEDREGASKRVFAHNDVQYGNIIRLARVQEGVPDHHQLIVIDLEYASPNPAAFDIGNHFHEWTADYHGAAPHILDPARYPSLKERRHFYMAYMAQSAMPPDTLGKEVLERELEKMDRLVRAWSPASQAMWALWGIVQARSGLEGGGGGGRPEFDYIGYSRCRIEGFRREVRALGIL